MVAVVLLILFWLMRLAALFGALAVGHRAGRGGSTRRALGWGLGALLLFGFAAWFVQHAIAGRACADARDQTVCLAGLDGD